ncbi:MAG TPA: hypothetical protein VIZ19_03295 [Roseiarcus sp.]
MHKSLPLHDFHPPDASQPVIALVARNSVTAQQQIILLRLDNRVNLLSIPHGIVIAIRTGVLYKEAGGIASPPSQAGPALLVESWPPRLWLALGVI